MTLVIVRNRQLAAIGMAKMWAFACLPRDLREANPVFPALAGEVAGMRQAPVYRASIAATIATASPGENGFRSNVHAPATGQPSHWILNPDISAHRTLGCWAVIRLTNSCPFIPGMSTSESIASNVLVPQRDIASDASTAAVTSYPARAKCRERSDRIARSSSTIKTCGT